MLTTRTPMKRTGFRPRVLALGMPADQYRLVPGGLEAHIELGLALAERTCTQIMEAGRWPTKLPLWQEGGSNAS